MGKHHRTITAEDAGHVFVGQDGETWRWGPKGTQYWASDKGRWRYFGINIEDYAPFVDMGKPPYYDDDDNG
jgi:hypothetical protein